MGETVMGDISDYARRARSPVLTATDMLVSRSPGEHDSPSGLAGTQGNEDLRGGGLNSNLRIRNHLRGFELGQY